MKKHVIGFKNEETKVIDNLLDEVNAQDLKNFGIIPELIGRLPIITFLKPLDKEAMRAILTEPKNALLKQYTKLFALDGKKLVVTDETLNKIVDKADDLGLGARGLRAVSEEIFTDLMYEIKDLPEKVTI